MSRRGPVEFIGMIGRQDLADLLLALDLAGGCDPHTLRVVARAVGVADALPPAVTIRVEQPARQLVGA